MRQFFRTNNQKLILILIFGLFLVVVPKTYGQVVESAPWLTTVGHPTGPAPGGGGNFIFYRQDDPRWQNDPTGNGHCHWGWAICGPTTIAMIMSTFGVVMTPDQTDNIATSTCLSTSGDPRICQKIRTCGDQPWTGTAGWDRFFSLPEFTSNGFHDTPLSISTSVENMRVWKHDYIDTGHLILASATSANALISHIFVVDDVNPDAVDSQGRAAPAIHLRDPARDSPEGYWLPATSPWISAGGTICTFVYAYAIIRQ